MADSTTLRILRIFRRIVVFSILPLAVGCPATARALHPILPFTLEQGPTNPSAAVWVFFADRGFAGDEARASALAAAQNRITDAALARRARAGAAIADEADLPVAAAYREAIAKIGRIRHESRWLNAVSVEVPIGEIEGITALPFVKNLRPVARGTLSGLGPKRAPDGRLLERPDPSTFVRIPRYPPRDDPYGPSFDQLEEIDVIAAHAAGYSGSRVRMMMLDTGFRKDHDAFLETDLLAEYDFIFDDGNVQNEAEDDSLAHWHGTVVWGTAGGYAPGALIGPAYRATFLLAKTEDIRSETQVEEDNYVAALEWGESLGVTVTSASLSYLCFDDEVCWEYEELDGDTAPITRAIDVAAARGILCVNSIGNKGPEPGTLTEPSDADTILSVGSVSPDGEISGFSGRGPRVDGMIKPEVVARGEDTWGANGLDPEGYLTVSGTSLAAPLIGGSVALVMEAHPEWSIYQVQQALMETAQRWGPPDNDYGYGRIQVWAAIESEPVVFPTPFDLLAPSDGEVVSDSPISFVWNRSADPQGAEVSYELWIDEDPDFATPMIYSDLGDTTYLHGLLPTAAYSWRVVAEDLDGYRRLSRCDGEFWSITPSGAGDPPVAIQEWRLEAVPNPCRQGSVLRWYTPPGVLRKEVRLTILDPSGRRLLRERIEGNSVGWNEWRWVPSHPDGSVLPAGVYFALLETSGQAARTRIVLTR